MSDAKDVTRALLGSWPSQVAAWGREALAAYLAELEARGVTPAAAVVAIRSCPAEQTFPPSAPELAALARRDPSRPTFEECYRQLYGPGGVFGSRRSGVVVSPWVLAFVASYGKDRLHRLEVDGDYGDIKRRELREAWERWLEANESRTVAEIATRRRGSLGAFDPLAALGGPRAQIGSGGER